MKASLPFTTLIHELKARISLAENPHVTRPFSDEEFDDWALRIFRAQFDHCPFYQRLCVAEDVAPDSVQSFLQIPSVPTSAFKDFDVTSLPPSERSRVFHSSGVTAQRPSRHYHDQESLSLYEASLWSWFRMQTALEGSPRYALLSLTPSPDQAVHSSLVHMLGTIGGHGRDHGFITEVCFTGELNADNSWRLDEKRTLNALREVISHGAPVLLAGTAFHYVQLLDWLDHSRERVALPPGSVVFETGGYKGRAREIPRLALRRAIEERLGGESLRILSEYGMSELSSQAYDLSPDPNTQRFRFAPWARSVLISPETGRLADSGEIGLIRVYDLANVHSVIGVQTEDLGRGFDGGFELVGRARGAERRGCSLMPADVRR